MKEPTASPHYYVGLLVSLLAVFVISPFFHEGALVNHLLNLSLLITLLFSVLAVSASKKLMLVAALLAVPLVIGTFQSTLGYDFQVTPLISGISGTAFVALIIVLMLRDMFTSTRVTAHLIIGAVSLYFLLGLMWGFIYVAVDYAFPASFSYTQGEVLSQGNGVDRLMYFSMVTLTTLGYGDITPVSSAARAMAAMEAVAGQLYLTVLVARLVGMHIAQKR